MNYTALLEKRDNYQKNKEIILSYEKFNYEQEFDVEYTNNSTGLEGNTLSSIETKILLEDKISIGGKKLQEIFEVINHNKAFQNIKGYINEKINLDEKIVKFIHAILMDNIMVGGEYRKSDTIIPGISYTPPAPFEVQNQIEIYFEYLKNSKRNNIDLAAWSHAEFFRLQPFISGNGTIARLIMNYQLMSNGFLPISIDKGKRLEYLDLLEDYARNGDLKPFADFIAKLEEDKLNFYLFSIDQQANIKLIQRIKENRR